MSLHGFPASVFWALSDVSRVLGSRAVSLASSISGGWRVLDISCAEAFPCASAISRILSLQGVPGALSASGAPGVAVQITAKEAYNLLKHLISSASECVFLLTIYFKPQRGQTRG